MGTARGVSAPLVIGSRIGWANNTGIFGTVLSDGTTLQETYQVGIPVPDNVNADGIQLLYQNHYGAASTGAETDGPNTIFLKASCSLGTAYTARFPVFFDGVRETTLEPGASRWSDPIPVPLIGTGQVLYVRSRPRVGTTGQKWPFQQPTYSQFGDGFTTGGTDIVDASTAITGFAAGNYGPSAIRAVASAATAGVIIDGDSITDGSDDVPDTTPLLGAKGWVGRALMSKVGAARIACGFTTAQNRADVINSSRRIAPLIGSATHAHIGYGTNDLRAGRTSTQLIADLTTIATRYRAQGIKPVMAKIPPNTEPGRIGAAWNVGGYRDLVNAWMDTALASGLLHAVQNPNTVWQSSTNADQWATIGGSSAGGAGGLHPSPAAHVAAAAVVNLGAYA